MPKITRRGALLAGASAAVVMPALPVLAVSGEEEDPLVALWQQVLVLRQESRRLDRLSGEASERGDRAEYERLFDLVSDIDDKWIAIEDRIMDAEPRTSEGWVIQAEVLADSIDSGSQTAKRIAAHLKGIADLERLAGRAS